MVVDTTVNRNTRACAPFNSDGLSANCRFCLSVPREQRNDASTICFIVPSILIFSAVSRQFLDFGVFLHSILQTTTTPTTTKLGTVMVIVIYAGQEIN